MFEEKEHVYCPYCGIAIGICAKCESPIKSVDWEYCDNCGASIDWD